MDRFKVLVESGSLWLNNFGIMVAMPLMGIIITVEVVLRYVFNYPLMWSKDLNGLVLLTVFFSGLSYCWVVGRHIRVDLFYHRFRGPLKGLADILAPLTGILYMLLLGIQSFKEVPYMIRTHETGELLEIPYWPFKVYMGFCSFYFALQLTISLLTVLFVMFSKRGENR